MWMAEFEAWFDQDLTQKIVVRHQESVTFTGDAASNMIGVRVFRYGEPVDLTGATVTGNVIRSDGATVTLTGTAAGNEASIVLSSNSLAIAGAIGVYIRVKVGDVQTTVFGGVFTVVSTDTGSIIDPGTIIPSIDALIAELQEKIAYLDRLENMEVTVTTLSPGTPATASVTQTEDTTTLALGIPQGAKGDTGNTGATGATPDISIGTVSTLPAGSSATATITGTAEEPVLNLGIPQGAKGDTGPQGPSASINDSTTDTTSTWSSTKISTEIGAIIDDADTAADSTWSSDKIAGMIDDAEIGANSTWSSSRISEELDAKMDASALEYGDTPCEHQKIGLAMIAWGSINVSASTTSYPTVYAGLFASAPKISVTYSKTGAVASGSWGAIKVHSVTQSGFSVVSAGSNPSSAVTADWIAVGVAASQSE